MPFGECRNRSVRMLHCTWSIINTLVISYSFLCNAQQIFTQQSTISWSTILYCTQTDTNIYAQAKKLLWTMKLWKQWIDTKLSNNTEVETRFWAISTIKGQMLQGTGWIKLPKKSVSAPAEWILSSQQERWRSFITRPIALVILALEVRCWMVGTRLLSELQAH